MKTIKTLTLSLTTLVLFCMTSCSDESTCFCETPVVTNTDTVYVTVEPLKPENQEKLEAVVREYFLSVYNSYQLYTETESFSNLKQVKGYDVYFIDYTWRSFHKETGDDWGISSRTYYVSIDFKIIIAANSKENFEYTFENYRNGSNDIKY